MRAVDIGWFCEASGPFTLAEMQRRWAAGELDRDDQVRHALEPQPGFAGDVEEFREATAPTIDIPCLHHPKRTALSFCLCCWAPICQKCMIGDRNCRRCHRGLYDRRLLAGVLDFCILPWLLFAVAGFSYALKGSHESPYYFEYSLIFGYPILLACYVLQKDWRGSLGKWMLGLRAVDLETRLPCGALPALQRNLLLAAVFFAPLALYQWNHPYLLVIFPILALVELSLAYRDPMMRRPSDYWAGTRVLRTLAGVHGRRADTRRRLKARNLRIDYPGSPPDRPESPPNSAPPAPPHPFDRPEPRPIDGPPGAARVAKADPAIAETDGSTGDLAP